MAVGRDDVKHVAALARLAITDDRIEQLTAELNTILGHMEVLSKVDTTNRDPLIDVGAERAPLQADKGPSTQLARPASDFAPNVKDRFFLVPRLSTHETGEES